MKITPARSLLYIGALCASVLGATAQIVEFRATINAAQENPATTSPATGTAIMHYNFANNTFDLVVSITGMTNLATASHLHEAAVGANGGVVTTLGGETAFTRSGNTLTATFTNIRHGGTPLTLMRGGAYFNIHSVQFPGGEVRGQLIGQPVKLYSKMDVAQEAAAMPTQNFAALNDFGGALMTYDPATNQMSLRTSVFNFTNTMNNSHFHAGAPGVSGGVVQNLGGNPNAAAGATATQLTTYSNVSGAIQGSYDGTFGGDPVVLVTGGTYLNYHSTTFGGGELRGQVYASQESVSSRLVNMALRGAVGTGDQVLIGGLVVQGTEPVRVLITAKGPSLSAFGITGGLANPRLALHDSAGRLIAQNDDVGTVAAGSELAAMPGVPRNTLESALVVVLPPGNYTAIVSATSGTGIALLEVTDVR